MGRDTFVSHEIDVDGGDQPSAQGLPPPHHHIDDPAAVEHGFDDLLPVFVGQVHVVDLEQPVVHPTEDKAQLVTTVCLTGTQTYCCQA